jgi:hypothetical protein
MRIITFLLVLLLPSLALAAPTVTSVTGNVSGKQQITITGSGFGSSGPKVVLFDDFSAGSVGSAHPTQAIVGNWNSAQAIIYSDPALSNGRGARCIKSSSTEGSAGGLTSVVTFPVTQEVFVSSTVYVPSGYKFPSASAPKTFPDQSAMKHFWLLYGSNGYSDSTKPDIVSPAWTSQVFYRVASNDPNLWTFDDQGGSASQAGEKIAWEWDKPVRWTLWAKGNGTSAAGTDGMFQGVSASWGVRGRSYKDYKPWFNADHTVKGWDRINIMGYARSGADFSQGHNWVIDDVYVATGPNAAARVEIGNASTYTACTNLALFTPDSWSSTSITATVRQGRFANGAKAYVYVADANGNVNSTGFPVTLGTSSTGGGDGGSTVTQVPLAPKNLRIQ